ncbi:lysylphosphatidylglycerol synthase transmembrane domain-containing protein [Spirosoma luteolum]
MSFFKRFLPLALGLALLAYALRNVSLAHVWQQFGLADYRWIVLTGLLTALTFGLRGMRSRQPLLALGYRPTTLRVTVALLTGTLMGMVIPGSGELTRCASLQRSDGVAFSHAVGAVLAERVLDFLILLGVVSLTVVLEFERLQQYFGGYALRLPSTTGWWLLGTGLLSAGALLWWARLTDFDQPRWQHPVVQRVVGFSRGLHQGLQSLGRLPNPVLFVVLTIMNQAMAWLMTYCLMRALPATRDLPILSVLTIETVSLLGSVLVPTQGGIGTYHLLVGRVLMLYGLSAPDSVTLATFLHAVGFVLTLLIGGLGFMLAPVVLKPHTQTARRFDTNS